MRRVVRLIRRTPKWASSSATFLLMAGGERPSFRPASAKLPSSATCRNTCNAVKRSTALFSGRKQFLRSFAHYHLTVNSLFLLQRISDGIQHDAPSYDRPYRTTL